MANSTPKSKSSLMAQLLGKYKPHVFSRGDQIPARVIKSIPGQVLLELGGKSEGVVEGKEYDLVRGFARSLGADDIVEVTIIYPETETGFALVSLQKAAKARFWQELLAAQEKKEPVRVTGKKVVRGGLVVELFGSSGLPLPAFIPVSQLTLSHSEDPQSLIGKTFNAQVLDLDRAQERVVLSERAVLGVEEKGRGARSGKSQNWEEVKRRFKPDFKMAGRVIKVTASNVFVDLGEGISGAIPTKSIPPGKMVRVGEEVGCIISGFVDKRQQVLLSLVLKEKPIGYK